MFLLISLTYDFASEQTGDILSEPRRHLAVREAVVVPVALVGRVVVALRRDDHRVVGADDLKTTA